MPNPTREGYAFAGWYADNEFKGERITSIGTAETGEKEYFAKWYALAYVIGENYVGASWNVGSGISMTYDENFVATATIVTNVSGAGAAAINVYSDGNYYVADGLANSGKIWLEAGKKYTISYHPDHDGGEGHSIVVYSAVEDAQFTATKVENEVTTNTTFEKYTSDSGSVLQLRADITVSSAATIGFKYGDTPITVSLENGSSGAMNNNVLAISSAGTYSIYLKAKNDGTFSMWVGQTSHQLSISSNQEDESWAPSSDVDIWAWVWTNDGSSTIDIGWVKCSHNNSYPITLTVDRPFTGFLLVRCPKDTETPDWGAKDDNPGRIYNKTGDISSNDFNLSNGVLVYNNSLGWVDYSPSNS